MQTRQLVQVQGFLVTFAKETFPPAITGTWLIIFTDVLSRAGKPIPTWPETDLAPALRFTFSQCWMKNGNGANYRSSGMHRRGPPRKHEVVL